MSEYVERAALQVAAPLAALVEGEVLTGGVTPDHFWRGYAELLRELVPANRALLERREALQRQIDDWHRAHRGQPHDGGAYQAFLREIGYLVPEPAPFALGTENVDPELAQVAGPQLVVPVGNARFALNAANARWGSLYDALYGTDALPGQAAPGGYDPARGAQVIAWARAHLDRVAPLAGASWGDITGVSAREGRLVASTPRGEAGLADPAHFAGTAGEDVFLRVNGLLIR